MGQGYRKRKGTSAATAPSLLLRKPPWQVDVVPGRSPGSALLQHSQGIELDELSRSRGSGSAGEAHVLAGAHATFEAAGALVQQCIDRLPLAGVQRHCGVRGPEPGLFERRVRYRTGC